MSSESIARFDIMRSWVTKLASFNSAKRVREWTIMGMAGCKLAKTENTRFRKTSFLCNCSNNRRKFLCKFRPWTNSRHFRYTAICTRVWILVCVILYCAQFLFWFMAKNIITDSDQIGSKKSGKIKLTFLTNITNKKLNYFFSLRDSTAEQCNVWFGRVRKIQGIAKTQKYIK